MTFPLLTLEQAAEALSQGKPVVLPTDTVYGVGVAVRAADSPQALFEAKGRPDGKPVAWLVADADALDEYGADVPPYARKLAQAFWPGALTLVVRASDAVPAAFQSADGTIGLRMPASEDALALIRAVTSPLAATSANLSGNAAPTALADLDPILVGATAGVLAPASATSANLSGNAVPTALADLDPILVGATAGVPAPAPAAAPAPTSAAAGPSAPASSSSSPTDSEGPAAGGMASTVLDCTGEAPRVLRQGALKLEYLLG